ncbi:FtsX-like permease family protein [Nocardiopsis changdeensis]|uniref:FtsX-like permease family protein n=1 Tax=Nocardiopsis TaxID=2013 RepID=UPI001C72CF4A|nr:MULTISPECIES: ABC transporter permease [Nocardiopsis]QYX37893.1 ABC transporter permease [Nocardiopsis sp. MT53]
MRTRDSLYFRYAYNDLRKNKGVTLALTVVLTLSAFLMATGAMVMERTVGAVDRLFEQAEPPHFLQMHRGDHDPGALARFAAEQPGIDAWLIKEMLGYDGASLTWRRPSTGETGDFGDSLIDNLFVTQNEEFDFLLDGTGAAPRPGPGEVYAPVAYRQRFDLRVGDELGIGTDGGVHRLRVQGFVRDAQMASSLASSTRFLVSEADHAALAAAGGGAPEIIVEYRLADPAGAADLQRAYEADADLPANGQAVTFAMIRLLNTFGDGLVAAALVFASLLLIAISLLNLRFVIRGTMEDRVREIGAMKAIGIPAREVSRLYLAKYGLMTLLACAAGGGLAVLALEPLTRGVRMNYAEPPPGPATVLVPLLALAVVYLFVLLVCRGVLRGVGRIEVVNALVHGSLLDERGTARRAARRARRVRRSALAPEPPAALDTTGVGAAGTEDPAAGGAAAGTGTVGTAGPDPKAPPPTPDASDTTGSTTGVPATRALATRPSGIALPGLGVNGRLVLLDLRAELGQWALVPAVFFLAAVLMTLPTNLLSTFEDPRFVTYMGAPQSDLRADLQFSDDVDAVRAALLADMHRDERLTGVRAFATVPYRVRGEEGWETLRVEVGDHSGDTVEFVEGGPPGAGEIALSVLNAQAFGVSAGDGLTVRRGGTDDGSGEAGEAGGTATLTVSGVYQDVTSGGFTAKAQGEVTSGATGYVVYADTVGDTDPAGVAADYGERFPTASVIPMREFVRQTLSHVTGTLHEIAVLSVVFGVGVAVFITSLFLELRLARDRRKTGVLSALGFSAREIAAQVRAKTLLAVALGTVAGLVFAATAGEAVVGALLAAAGLGIADLALLPDPLLVYAAYPLLLVGAGYLGAVFLTARPRGTDKSAWLRS